MNSLEVRFVCPQCARPIRCDRRLAGREVHCPDCQQLLVIPHPAQGGQSFVGEREVRAAPAVRPVGMTGRIAVGALLGAFLAPVLMRYFHILAAFVFARDGREDLGARLVVVGQLLLSGALFSGLALLGALAGGTWAHRRFLARHDRARPTIQETPASVSAVAAWHVRQRGELAFAGVGLVGGTFWLVPQAAVYLLPTLPANGMLGLLLYGLWHTRGPVLSGRRQAVGLLLLAATLSALAVTAARTTGVSWAAWGLGLPVIAGGLFCWTGWSLRRCLFWSVVLLAFPLGVAPLIRGIGPLLIVDPWKATRRWLPRLLPR